MHLQRLWLHAFRSYTEAEIEFAPGLTVIRGANGTGKSNLLEAAGYLATLASFRGAPSEALVQLAAAPESPPAGFPSAGPLSARPPGRPDAPQERAVIRGHVQRGQRDLLIETEIVPGGRNRTMVNKQPLSRRDPDASLQVSVFSPDDLILVKGGPGERRAFLDELLAGLHPRNDAALKELDRILRQRNALLKQASGRLTPEVGFTLDVWDAKLASTGTAVATLRQALLDELRTFVDEAYSTSPTGRRRSHCVTSRHGWSVSTGWAVRCATAAPTMCDGVFPLSALTATRSTCASRAARRAPMPHRASSAPWHLRCGLGDIG